MDETEIASAVDAEISSAQEAFRSGRKGDTSKAIEYSRGEMSDLPSEDGRSSVVDHTTQDVMGWLLPGIMRVYFSSDQIVVYDPKGPEDEEGAEQATDYINHIVLKESEAYRVFWDWFHDALLHRNGVVKHFWDATPVTAVEKHFALTDDQFVELTSSDDVEVLEHTEQEELEPAGVDPFTGEEAMAPVILHDVRVRKMLAPGSLRLEAVAPEDFLINDEAKEINERTRFVGERILTTRSALIEQGYSRVDVDDLVSGKSDLDGVALARSGNHWAGSSMKDHATEDIEIYECYPLIDYDGDGIAERLKVIWAHGGHGKKALLDWEEWEDELPYSDLTPERVPHRWEGRSVFDDTVDLQQIRTVLQRNLLDGIYQNAFPDEYIDISRVKNPDAVFDRVIGRKIMVEGDPSGIAYSPPMQNSAAQMLQALEYTDQIIERRTGVSRSAMGLDPETLQNQSATAATIQQSAQYSKIELIARNFAELGMKRVFKCLLKLVVKHQDKARTVRLRNKWVEMDPSRWNADMDVTINVGLGSGSRDRDLGFLNLVLQQQQAAFGMAGGMGSPYGQKLAKAMLHTAQKIIEATGLKSPDMYFPEVTDEDMQAIAEQQKQNPEAMKMQAEMQATMQLEQAKSQVTMQIEAARLQAQMQMKQLDIQAKMQGDQAQMQLQAEMEQIKAQIASSSEAEKLQSRALVEREQAQADMMVRQRETEASIALEQQKFAFARELKLLEFDLKGKQQANGHAVNGNTQNGNGAPAKEDSGHTALMAEITELMRLAAAPKRVIRDENNLIIGVEPDAAPMGD
ncbi:MAG: hypothetical protein H0U59_11105 [Gemmatimonadaceae bacterium]|nr:hypothetical protein [Gemmatimonadaceae bacterium]